MLACSSSSWLSGGCLLLLCGSTTVRRSGFSALSAPRNHSRISSGGS